MQKIIPTVEGSFFTDCEIRSAVWGNLMTPTPEYMNKKVKVLQIAQVTEKRYVFELLFVNVN